MISPRVLVRTKTKIYIGVRKEQPRPLPMCQGIKRQNAINAAGTGPRHTALNNYRSPKLLSPRGDIERMQAEDSVSVHIGFRNYVDCAGSLVDYRCARNTDLRHEIISTVNHRRRQRRS